MKWLQEMMSLQRQHGAVTDASLQTLAKKAVLPLYRLEALRSFYPAFTNTPSDKQQIHLCRDLSCHMRNRHHFSQMLTELNALPNVEAHAVSCLGRCDIAPAAIYDGVVCTANREVLRDIAAGKTPAKPAQTPFECFTDPYLNADEHYQVLQQLLKRAEALNNLNKVKNGAQQHERNVTHTATECESVPAEIANEIIATLQAAELRGMGGAGFPTGRKWKSARQAAGTTKYVICNADESEPGTFKDRDLLANVPHLMIESMIIAGWVVGATKGIIYLRHEYEPEGKKIEQALQLARKKGLLGKNIANSGCNFEISIFVSPGGYILGEETALLEALEDKRGEPRNKPPFPTDEGLWGKPTLMNNVETFVAIPIILCWGAEWWKQQGVGQATGMKYFSVSGDVKQPGVYCVPMGTSVRTLLERCGGMIDDKPLKAFAPGGASSRFLSIDALDVLLDFDSLQQAGSMLGSGAVIFVSEETDLLDLGLSALRFFRNESCGKCVPCRVGTHKAVEWMEQAFQQEPAADLVASLEEMADTLEQTSICGLGQVALQPLLSIIHNFPEEAARLEKR